MSHLVVVQVRFSAEAHYYATASRDNTIKVFLLDIACLASNLIDNIHRFGTASAIAAPQHSKRRTRQLSSVFK